MKKSRFSESQIVGVLKEHEAGAPTNDPLHIAVVFDDPLAVHHMVFAGTDGSDDDWATFSDWVRSYLTHDLVAFNEEFTRLAPSEPWTEWYAKHLMANYR